MGFGLKMQLGGHDSQPFEAKPENPVSPLQTLDRRQISNSLSGDLPLNFHPVAIRAPAVLNTPSGAV